MAAYLLQVEMTASDPQRYVPFRTLLKAAGAAPVMASSWVFEAAHSVQEMIRIIAAELDPKDRYFLIEIPEKTKWGAVGMNRQLTDWMQGKRP